MRLSKVGLVMVIGLVAPAGCGGSGQDTGHDAAAAPVDPVAPVEMLGGGALTPIHDGQAGSPHVRVAWDVSGANISITYGRPFLNGRTVGGSVEPLEGRVWRLGADEATTLTTDRDLMLGAAHVPAGEYTLWTISNGDATELIVSHETGRWGTDYNESRDLGRTPMTVGTLDTPSEQLTLHIEDSELRFEWGGDGRLGADHGALAVSFYKYSVAPTRSSLVSNRAASRGRDRDPSSAGRRVGPSLSSPAPEWHEPAREERGF